ncbi:MAG: hypothetical protein ABFR97_04775 [Thermodesulfobacteriota bacterium]
MPDMAQCWGHCPRCDLPHSLNRGPSLPAAEELKERLIMADSIDLDNPPASRKTDLSLAYLRGPARGQMFGVMVYEDRAGRRGTARAFSGQYNGRWQVAGWAEPLFAVEDFQELTLPVEARIKALTVELTSLPAGEPAHAKARRKRQALSRQLMLDIQQLYQVHNFRQQKRALPQIFLGNGGIPTGTGDCCGPKLLNHAARHGLRPLGISEFYLGQTNRSESRRHGLYYQSCAAKCRPILGYMLCGLEGL